MANIRDLNGKIISLRNMQKVMRAMNMIASTKLRKLLRTHGALQSFLKAIESVHQALMGSCSDSEDPVITGYKNIQRSHVVLFTADKGLCGSHNMNVKKAMESLMDTTMQEKITTDFTCIGTKGARYCRQREYEIYKQVEIHEKMLSMKDVKGIATALYNRFLENDVQRVSIIYNKFISTLVQETKVLQLLPLARTDTSDPGISFAGYTEPARDLFLRQAAGLYVYYALQSALMNSRLSEQAARMTAMENATNNSEDLIHRYVRARNKVRQATITNELIEIISGKEAMKGYY